MGNRFRRYELRTTDVPAARAFYTAVLGAELWDQGASVVPLPERARARGAPAHWLGYLGVDDVEATSLRFVASGAEQLGPLSRAPDGSLDAVLRDPAGAVVGLSSRKGEPPAECVSWRLLHARDEAAAFSAYASLLGWTPTERFDGGSELGRHQHFAWDASGQVAGSVANTAHLPHVHSHWLFFFRVENLAESLAQVRAHGGFTLPAVQMATGDRVAPCDDPEGAAFGLMESR